MAQIRVIRLRATASFPAQGATTWGTQLLPAHDPAVRRTMPAADPDAIGSVRRAPMPDRDQRAPGEGRAANCRAAQRGGMRRRHVQLDDDRRNDRSGHCFVHGRLPRTWLLCGTNVRRDYTNAFLPCLLPALRALVRNDLRPNFPPIKSRVLG